ncbi:MAG: nitroreductase family protein [Myxococcota bacterium]
MPSMKRDCSVGRADVELYEAIRTRRTAHKWRPEPLADDVLNRLLEAAHWAPCHKLTWPWRFTVVGPETRAGLADIAVALKAAKSGPLTNDAATRTRAKLLNPGALVVVRQKLLEDPFRRKEDYAATSCAIQNMCLAAAAEGLCAKWSTGGVTRAEATYALLGHDPAIEEIVGFVAIGVPERVLEGRRPPLEPAFVERLP